MRPEKNEEVQKHGREDLAGEHKLGDLEQLIIAVLFIAVWILDSFVFHYTTFLNDYIPLWVQIPLGVILLALALYLARTGMKIVFGEVPATPGVIKKGPFKLVRHPIYLSEILFYLGLLVFRTSLAAVFIWILAIVFFVFIARYEEKLLLARFGDDYKAYMKDVGMYLPRLWKRS
ncbi:MAG: methyltransferase family protein [Dehalococcoidales bacterium]